MEDLAPPVVAVIVTHDPGPWFEQTLRAFGAQDYPELSFLVLDAGSSEDPTGRVAAVLPHAFVRRLPDNRGFAASADEVLAMVRGASHLLLCHDDVAPDPDAVHILVEESFRSNAGIVGPKLVAWDDPERLLHVGMAVDKGGAVVDRVEPGEIDHGQHDAVRDVFMAPGGCMLVRADLFAELGGFDAAVVAMGEDLDLCWRAQAAGARVMVAPAARVRHLERLASGTLPLPPALSADLPGHLSGASRRGRRWTLQALQRRHELRVALSSYGRLHLARVVPQLVLLALAELAVAVLTGNRDRAVVVAHAWRWNWRRRRELRARRLALSAHRRLGDAEVRRLQLHGSARLTAYVRRAVTHGLEVAHAGAEAELAVAASDEPAPRRREPGASARTAVVAVLALVLVVGSRQILGAGLPFVAGFLPFPSWGGFLHRFAAGWQPSGVGTTDPTSPATAVLGVAGLLLGGSTGLLQKILVLGSLPVGALGAARLARPFGSWPRLVTGVTYLALPIAYDAIAGGRFDALLCFAAVPWVTTRLARASAVEPYGELPPPRASWRVRLPGQVLGLGVLEALVCSMVPSAMVLTLLVAAALAAGLVVTGGRDGGRAARRVLGVAAGSCALAVVVLAPWSIALLEGPERWQAIAGVALVPSGAPGWWQVVRLAVGPIGATPLAYGLVAAAALPLFIGARRRLRWAVHAWLLALVSWGVAWASGRGWLGALDVPTLVLLVPAALALALAVGLGLAAFERDLSAHRFGWRQSAGALAAAAAALGALPVLGAAGGGRWDTPTSGYGQSTSWMATRSPPGGFRVVWLGDPRALPGAGWQLEPGVAFTVSDGGLPDATGAWPGADQGSATPVTRALELAADGSTVELGRLLAPYAVRYVVVVGALAPQIPGYQRTAAYPVPASLQRGLDQQVDLRQLIAQGGMSVYEDTAALPEVALHALPVDTSGTAPPAALAGWAPGPTLGAAATSVSGQVPAGAVAVLRAPPGSFELVGPGGASSGVGAFGYGNRFDAARSGPVVLRYHGSWGHAVAVVAEVALWMALAAVLLARRRWIERLWARARIRRGPAGGAEADEHERARLGTWP